jgi:hypothetical protein
MFPHLNHLRRNEILGLFFGYFHQWVKEFLIFFSAKVVQSWFIMQKKNLKPFFFSQKSIGETIITKGVSHSGLAIYIKKYLKAKEELWKFEYFTMHKYNLQKKNPSRYHNSITNLKFQHKPEYHLSKILV